VNVQDFHNSRMSGWFGVVHDFRYLCMTFIVVSAFGIDVIVVTIIIAVVIVVTIFKSPESIQQGH